MLYYNTKGFHSEKKFSTESKGFRGAQKRRKMGLGNPFGLGISEAISLAQTRPKAHFFRGHPPLSTLPKLPSAGNWLVSVVRITPS